MIQHLLHHKFFKAIAIVVIVAYITLIPAQSGFAQSLPQPGQMILPTESMNPILMTGLKVDLKNPFNFSFVMEDGDSQLYGDFKNEEYLKLIRYFMAALITPNKDMWVNLSPVESDRIITDNFIKTEMGRDLLAQDYLLKQFTSSLMYPEDATGKAFWDKLYSKIYQKYGSTEIPIDTFNKVWIAADTADIYQKEQTAFIVKSHLKVMLEQDFLSIGNNESRFAKDISQPQTSQSRDIAAEVMRDVIIPLIEKEVNEGETFAQVRQVYHSMILASWFKRALKNSLLAQVYVDQQKVEGIELQEQEEKERIYQQYLKAYERGVFNYIKEEIDIATQELLPRKYFSGGVHLLDAEKAIKDASQQEAAQVLAKSSPNVIVVDFMNVHGETFAIRIDPKLQQAREDFQGVAIKTANAQEEVRKAQEEVRKAQLIVEEDLRASQQRLNALMNDIKTYTADLRSARQRLQRLKDNQGETLNDAKQVVNLKRSLASAQERRKALEAQLKEDQAQLAQLKESKNNIISQLIAKGQDRLAQMFSVWRRGALVLMAMAGMAMGGRAQEIKNFESNSVKNVYAQTVKETSKVRTATDLYIQPSGEIEVHGALRNGIRPITLLSNPQKVIATMTKRGSFNFTVGNTQQESIIWERRNNKGIFESLIVVSPKGVMNAQIFPQEFSKGYPSKGLVILGYVDQTGSRNVVEFSSTINSDGTVVYHIDVNRVIGSARKADDIKLGDNTLKEIGLTQDDIVVAVEEITGAPIKYFLMRKQGNREIGRIHNLGGNEFNVITYGIKNGEFNSFLCKLKEGELNLVETIKTAQTDFHETFSLTQLSAIVKGHPELIQYIKEGIGNVLESIKIGRVTQNDINNVRFVRTKEDDGTLIYHIEGDRLIRPILKWSNPLNILVNTEFKGDEVLGGYKLYRGEIQPVTTQFSDNNDFLTGVLEGSTHNVEVGKEIEKVWGLLKQFEGKTDGWKITTTKLEGQVETIEYRLSKDRQNRVFMTVLKELGIIRNIVVGTSFDIKTGYTTKAYKFSSDYQIMARVETTRKVSLKKMISEGINRAFETVKEHFNDGISDIEAGYASLGIDVNQVEGVEITETLYETESVSIETTDNVSQKALSLMEEYNRKNTSQKRRGELLKQIITFSRENKAPIRFLSQEGKSVSHILIPQFLGGSDILTIGANGETIVHFPWQGIVPSSMIMSSQGSLLRSMIVSPATMQTVTDLNGQPIQVPVHTFDIRNDIQEGLLTKRIITRGGTVIAEHFMKLLNDLAGGWAGRQVQKDTTVVVYYDYFARPLSFLYAQNKNTGSIVQVPYEIIHKGGEIFVRYVAQESTADGFYKKEIETFGPDGNSKGKKAEGAWTKYGEDIAKRTDVIGGLIGIFFSVLGIGYLLANKRVNQNRKKIVEEAQQRASQESVSVDQALLDKVQKVPHQTDQAQTAEVKKAVDIVWENSIASALVRGRNIQSIVQNNMNAYSIWLGKELKQIDISTPDKLDQTLKELYSLMEEYQVKTFAMTKQRNQNPDAFILQDAERIFERFVLDPIRRGDDPQEVLKRNWDIYQKLVAFQKIPNVGSSDQMSFSALFDLMKASQQDLERITNQTVGFSQDLVIQIKKEFNAVMDDIRKGELIENRMYAVFKLYQNYHQRFKDEEIDFELTLENLWQMQLLQAGSGMIVTMPAVKNYLFRELLKLKQQNKDITHFADFVLKESTRWHRLMAVQQSRMQNIFAGVFKNVIPYQHYFQLKDINDMFENVNFVNFYNEFDYTIDGNTDARDKVYQALLDELDKKTLALKQYVEKIAPSLDNNVHWIKAKVGKQKIYKEYVQFFREIQQEGGWKGASKPLIRQSFISHVAEISGFESLPGIRMIRPFLFMVRSLYKSFFMTAFYGTLSVSLALFFIGSISLPVVGVILGVAVVGLIGFYYLLDAWFNNGINTKIFGKTPKIWEGHEKKSTPESIRNQIIYGALTGTLHVSFGTFVWMSILTVVKSMLGATILGGILANWLVIGITIIPLAIILFYAQRFAVNHIIMSKWATFITQSYGVGDITTAKDVQKVSKIEPITQQKEIELAIESKFLPKGLSLSDDRRKEFLNKFWKTIAEQMRKTSAISKEEYEAIKEGKIEQTFKTSEIQNRIVIFVNQLLQETPDMPLLELQKTSGTIIPVVSEDIRYPSQSKTGIATALLDKLNTEDRNLDRLIRQYPQEWENFIELMIEKHGQGNKDIEDGIKNVFSKNTFDENDPFYKLIEEDLRSWGDYRGQSFARTLNGIMNIIRMRRLQAEIQHPEWNNDQIAEYLRTTEQFIWAYQVFGNVLKAANEWDALKKKDTLNMLKEYFEELSFNIELASLQELEVKKANEKGEIETKKIWHRVISEYNQGRAVVQKTTLPQELIQTLLQQGLASEIDQESIRLKVDYDQTKLNQHILQSIHQLLNLGTEQGIKKDDFFFLNDMVSLEKQGLIDLIKDDKENVLFIKIKVEKRNALIKLLTEKVYGQLTQIGIVDKYKVALTPYHPILVEGKPGNLINALMALWPIVGRAIDMNQDFDIEQAMFALLANEEFRNNPNLALLGYPERITTGGFGWVGQVGSTEDRTFNSHSQPSLQALKLRFHYGHPDEYATAIIKSIGGTAAQEHVNEDIFLGKWLMFYGFDTKLIYYLQAAKAREISFIGLFGLLLKFGMGAAQQMFSRESYYMNQYMSPVRVDAHHFNGPGHFDKKYAISLALVGIVIASLFLGTGGFQAMLHVAGWALIGLLYFGEAIMEGGFYQKVKDHGFWKGVGIFLKELPYLMAIAIANIQSPSAGVKQAMLGNASYQATGRGWNLAHQNTELFFKTYLKTHLFDATVLVGLIGLSMVLWQTPFFIFSILLMFKWLADLIVSIISNRGSWAVNGVKPKVSWRFFKTDFKDLWSMIWNDIFLDGLMPPETSVGKAGGVIERTWKTKTRAEKIALLKEFRWKNWKKTFHDTPIYIIGAIGWTLVLAIGMIFTVASKLIVQKIKNSKNQKQAISQAISAESYPSTGRSFDSLDNRNNATSQPKKKDSSQSVSVGSSLKTMFLALIASVLMAFGVKGQELEPKQESLSGTSAITNVEHEVSANQWLLQQKQEQEEKMRQSIRKNLADQQSNLIKMEALKKVIDQRSGDEQNEEFQKQYQAFYDAVVKANESNRALIADVKKFIQESDFDNKEEILSIIVHLEFNDFSTALAPLVHGNPMSVGLGFGGRVGTPIELGISLYNITLAQGVLGQTLAAWYAFDKGVDVYNQIRLGGDIGKNGAVIFLDHDDGFRGLKLGVLNIGHKRGTSWKDIFHWGTADAGLDLGSNLRATAGFNLRSGFLNADIGTINLARLRLLRTLVGPDGGIGASIEKTLVESNFPLETSLQDLIRLIVEESNTHPATIIYSSHLEKMQRKARTNTNPDISYYYKRVGKQLQIVSYDQTGVELLLANQDIFLPETETLLTSKGQWMEDGARVRIYDLVPVMQAQEHLTSLLQYGASVNEINGKVKTLGKYDIGLTTQALVPQIDPKTGDFVLVNGKKVLVKADINPVTGELILSQGLQRFVETEMFKTMAPGHYTFKQVQQWAESRGISADQIASLFPQQQGVDIPYAKILTLSGKTIHIAQQDAVALQALKLKVVPQGEKVTINFGNNNITPLVLEEGTVYGTFDNGDMYVVEYSLHASDLVIGRDGVARVEPINKISITGEISPKDVPSEILKIAQERLSNIIAEQMTQQEMTVTIQKTIQDFFGINVEQTDLLTYQGRQNLIKALEKAAQELGESETEKGFLDKLANAIGVQLAAYSGAAGEDEYNANRIGAFLGATFRFHYFDGTLLEGAELAAGWQGWLSLRDTVSIHETGMMTVYDNEGNIIYSDKEVTKTKSQEIEKLLYPKVAAKFRLWSREIKTKEAVETGEKNPYLGLIPQSSTITTDAPVVEQTPEQGGIFVNAQGELVFLSLIHDFFRAEHNDLLLKGEAVLIVPGEESRAITAEDINGEFLTGQRKVVPLQWIPQGVLGVSQTNNQYTVTFTNGATQESLSKETLVMLEEGDFGKGSSYRIVGIVGPQQQMLEEGLRLNQLQQSALAHVGSVIVISQKTGEIIFAPQTWINEQFNQDDLVKANIRSEADLVQLMLNGAIEEVSSPTGKPMLTLNPLYENIPDSLSQTESALIHPIRVLPQAHAKTLKELAEKNIQLIYLDGGEMKSRWVAKDLVNQSTYFTVLSDAKEVREYEYNAQAGNVLKATGMPMFASETIELVPLDNMTSFIEENALIMLQDANDSTINSSLGFAPLSQLPSAEIQKKLAQIKGVKNYHMLLTDHEGKVVIDQQGNAVVKQTVILMLNGDVRLINVKDIDQYVFVENETSSGFVEKGLFSQAEQKEIVLETMTDTEGNATHGFTVDAQNFTDGDIQTLVDLGVNAVRFYYPPSIELLQKLGNAGIKTFSIDMPLNQEAYKANNLSFYYGQEVPAVSDQIRLDQMSKVVDYLKSLPEGSKVNINIGNEWNLSETYTAWTGEDWFKGLKREVNAFKKDIEDIEGLNITISTILGDSPTLAADIQNVAALGVNSIGFNWYRHDEGVGILLAIQKAGYQGTIWIAECGHHAGDGLNIQGALMKNDIESFINKGYGFYLMGLRANNQRETKEQQWGIMSPEQESIRKMIAEAFKRPASEKKPKIEIGNTSEVAQPSRTMTFDQNGNVIGEMVRIRDLKTGNIKWEEWLYKNAEGNLKNHVLMVYPFVEGQPVKTEFILLEDLQSLLPEELQAFRDEIIEKKIKMHQLTLEQFQEGVGEATEGVETPETLETTQEQPEVLSEEEGQTITGAPQPVETQQQAVKEEGVSQEETQQDKPQQELGPRIVPSPEIVNPQAGDIFKRFYEDIYNPLLNGRLLVGASHNEEETATKQGTDLFVDQEKKKLEELKEKIAEASDRWKKDEESWQETQTQEAKKRAEEMTARLREEAEKARQLKEENERVAGLFASAIEEAKNMPKALPPASEDVRRLNEVSEELVPVLEEQQEALAKRADVVVAEQPEAVTKIEPVVREVIQEIKKAVEQQPDVDDLQDELALLNIKERELKEGMQERTLRIKELIQLEATYEAQINEIANKNYIADLSTEEKILEAQRAIEEAQRKREAIFQQWKKAINDHKEAQLAVIELRKELKTLQQEVQQKQEQIEQTKAGNTTDPSHLDRVGGIDMSDEYLTINIKVDGDGIPLSAEFQDPVVMNITGLMPVIKDVQPLTMSNVPVLAELIR